MLRRRNFLASTAGLIASTVLPNFINAAPALPEVKKKIAFLGTVAFQHSHSQHFLDRLTVGYTWRGAWQSPRLDVASVYLDQFPENDLGRQRIEKYRLRQFGSIREALTLGGESLAVDGVVIIAEHGDYEHNNKGQKLYPRYKWFKEVVKVFEESGRSVPVFNDKHLSTDWHECVEMVNDSKRLQFPVLAGSSLPVTLRHPAIDLPHDCDLRESVCVAYGGIDSYDFHAYETAQCMSERRRGGEVGISSVHGLQGELLWRELESPDRSRTRELFLAALCRSHNLPVEGGFPTAKISYEWAKATLPETTGFFVQHRDGFRTTVFLSGIRDFNYAGLIGSTGEIVTCQMYLPMPGHGSTTADFFNPLARHIEELVLTRKAPYALERTLLTSGMVIGGVESLHAGQTRFETPEMAVAYHSQKESTFWRD
ncbi:MAG: hypothetical protein NTW75_10415 [Planctomycetales bacterium]|nr:hypothetical protein [Planctomycetales bacterium]